MGSCRIVKGRSGKLGKVGFGRVGVWGFVCINDVRSPDFLVLR